VPNHDYRGALAALAAGLGLHVDLSMEGLDTILKERGWRPGGEALSRLKIDNIWLQKRLRAEELQAGHHG
jgi:hypothetical protein